MEIIQNKQQLEYYIKKSKINEHLLPELFDFYKQSMFLVSFEKNEYIFNHPEDDIPFLYFFLAGKIKVSSTMSNGKSQLLYFYSKEGILGDLEMFNMANPYTTVQAVEKSYCIALDLRTTKDALLKDQIFLLYLVKTIAIKLSRSSSNNSLNIYYPLENRLCSYINAMASEDIKLISTGQRVYKEGLAETSEVLGSSYRHLQRTLKTLCGKGIIEKKGKYYIILDEKSLGDLSQDIFI